MYILSLWFLFLLIIIVTVDIPFCYGGDCRFIGFSSLLKRNIISVIAFVFLLFGTVYYFRFDYRITGSKSIAARVVKIEDVNYEHLTFLTTYIIPLICFNLTSVRYLLALGVLLFIIGVIYIKTDKFYANPTLAVLGFRVYKVNLQTRVGLIEGIVVISKERLAMGDQISRLGLDDKVFFVRKA
ncbi:anti-phage protein KwaA [Pseudomonas sp. P9_31]|uniref:anti-phage protein KwaA n=1 Tax=Pseudomonas sp. P9_31 TaxID=3043448 RepID=UPI002A364309|nr:anti-phage protein KwaA [Pseudomonas sp. P9_31]WPN57132.1 anti-phage protein KwaA [Pseudomonas sp. P9_31]